MPTNDGKRVVRVVVNGEHKPDDNLKKTKVKLDEDWQAIARKRQGEAAKKGEKGEK